MESEAIKNDRLTLDIFDLASTGEGIGRDPSGRTFFVPRTLPGDRVEVSVTKVFPTFSFAEVTRLLSPSPERSEPPCPIFGVCGGCDWQHIPPPKQAFWKARLLTQTLQRLGSVEIQGTIPILPAATDLGIRSRLRLHPTPEGKLGFYRPSSHHAIPISSCPVLVPALQDFLATLDLQPPPPSLPVSDLRLLAESELPSSRLALSLHLESKKKATAPPSPRKPFRAPSLSVDPSDLIRAFRSWVVGLQTSAPALLSAELWQGSRRLAQIGSDGLFVGEPPILYHASGFAQASFRMNRHLVETVTSLAQASGVSRILEVYAGSGNLSIPLALAGFSILALEAEPAALADAQASAQRLPPEVQKRIAFAAFHDERHSFAEICQRRGFRPDMLLVDPPRQGLSASLRRQIASLAFPYLLYVSCDPATLARDLREILASGYHLVQAQAIDLIPHTAHIESVILLRKNAETPSSGFLQP